MILSVFIFLAAAGITTFYVSNHTKRISHLVYSIVINLICVLASFTSFDLVMTKSITNSTAITTVNATTNTTITVTNTTATISYTKAYFDFYTASVISAMFMLAVIVSILQIWYVVSRDVKRGVEKGDYERWNV